MTVVMLAGCLLVAGAVFWKVGTSGTGNSLFLLLRLACPLLHFFIHRKDGHRGDVERQVSPVVGDDGQPSDS